MWDMKYFHRIWGCKYLIFSMHCGKVVYIFDLHDFYFKIIYTGTIGSFQIPRQGHTSLRDSLNRVAELSVQNFYLQCMKGSITR